MQDTRWDELRSTKLGFSKRAPASAEPPYHAQKVQKNRKQLSPPIFQHHQETNWPQIRWEGSHRVTHTPSGQTGGLTELPELQQDEKTQP